MLLNQGHIVWIEWDKRQGRNKVGMRWEKKKEHGGKTPGKKKEHEGKTPDKKKEHGGKTPDKRPKQEYCDNKMRSGTYPPGFASCAILSYFALVVQAIAPYFAVIGQAIHPYFAVIGQAIHPYFAVIGPEIHS